jgi:hypothetical protein
VAYYLTIPEVTEAEELVAFNPGSSPHSFDIVINAGTTSTWLFRAATDGTFIPLVVVVTDGGTTALDDVVVSGAASGGSPVEAYMTFTLDAQAVRFV